MKTKKRNATDAGKEVFAKIFGRFPKFKREERSSDSAVLGVTMPVQKGLKYEIGLKLRDDDELCFSVGKYEFLLSPVTDDKRVEEFIESVSGFLSGEWRVVERYRGDACIAAELQSPTEGNWRTVGRWGVLMYLPWPKGTPSKELINK